MGKIRVDIIGAGFLYAALMLLIDGVPGAKEGASYLAAQGILWGVALACLCSVAFLAPTEKIALVRRRQGIRLRIFRRGHRIGGDDRCVDGSSPAVRSRIVRGRFIGSDGDDMAQNVRTLCHGRCSGVFRYRSCG